MRMPLSQRHANADDKRTADGAGRKYEQYEELRANPAGAVCSFDNTEEV